MRSPTAYLFAILVGAIIWFFFQFFKIEGTQTLRVVPKDEAEINRTAEEGEKDFKFKLPRFFSGDPTDDDAGTQAVSVEPLMELTPRKSPNSIRIASFHLHDFGEPARRESTQRILLQILRHFDILALQGMRPDGGAAAVAELATMAGDGYAAIVGRPSVVQHQDEQFAFLYNTNTIVADRTVGLYTLGDPDDLLLREPLIGWFRAKEAPADEAFTFSLVNVNTDKYRVRQELNVLDNVIAEVRADGRQEDDVIMLGSFQARDDHLFELGKIRGLVPAIRSLATNLEGTSQTENILFQDPDTDEFTHITGVYDFRQACGLSFEQASEVARFMPVWAEFSIFEGGQRRMASVPR